MAESYLYNPSETITKGFANVQANVANMFSGIIAQKQNDYNLAEKTFENIDALTDKLGEYGQEEIVSKTQGLLDDAAKSIIKNGKLDYSELGRIRNGVSAIKNRKSALEAGTQMYKEMAQTALATKDDLLSLSATLGDMKNILLNPNNLSAEDMGKQMQSVYQKNINTTKLAGDVLNRIAPATEYDMTYTKDGAEKRITGTKVVGMNLDPLTGKFEAPAPTVITNPDGTTTTQSYIQSLVDKIKQQAPTLLSSIKAQMGDHGIMQTDEQLLAPYIQTYLQTKNTASKDIEVKSKAQIDTENVTAKLKGKELANFDTKTNLENQKLRGEIGYTAEKTKGARLENQLTEGLVSNATPLEQMGITVANGTKNLNFGQSIKVNSIMVNGKMTPFVATDLAYDSNKKMHYIKGRPAPKGFEGQLEASDLGEEVAIPVSTNSISYKNLVSAINGPALTKAKSQNARARMNRFSNVEVGGEAPVSNQAKPSTNPAQVQKKYVGEISAEKLRSLVADGVYPNIDAAEKDAIKNNLKVTGNLSK